MSQGIQQINKIDSIIDKLRHFRNDMVNQKKERQLPKLENTAGLVRKRVIVDKFYNRQRDTKQTSQGAVPNDARQLCLKGQGFKSPLCRYNNTSVRKSKKSSHAQTQTKQERNLSFSNANFDSNSDVMLQYIYLKQNWPDMVVGEKMGAKNNQGAKSVFLSQNEFYTTFSKDLNTLQGQYKKFFNEFETLQKYLEFKQIQQTIISQKEAAKKKNIQTSALLQSTPDSEQRQAFKSEHMSGYYKLRDRRSECQNAQNDGVSAWKTRPDYFNSPLLRIQSIDTDSQQDRSMREKGQTYQSNKTGKKTRIRRSKLKLEKEEVQIEVEGQKSFLQLNRKSPLDISLKNSPKTLKKDFKKIELSSSPQQDLSKSNQCIMNPKKFHDRIMTPDQSGSHKSSRTLIRNKECVVLRPESDLGNEDESRLNIVTTPSNDQSIIRRNFSFTSDSNYDQEKQEQRLPTSTADMTFIKNESINMFVLANKDSAKNLSPVPYSNIEPNMHAKIITSSKKVERVPAEQSQNQFKQKQLSDEIRELLDNEPYYQKDDPYLQINKQAENSSKKFHHVYVIGRGPLLPPVNERNSQSESKPETALNKPSNTQQTESKRNQFELIDNFVDINTVQPSLNTSILQKKSIPTSPSPQPLIGMSPPKKMQTPNVIRLELLANRPTAYDSPFKSHQKNFKQMPRGLLAQYLRQTLNQKVRKKSN